MAKERTETAEPEAAQASPATAAGDGKAAHALPDPDTCRELLETMALIRRFEEEAGRQYQQAKAGGFLHLAIGEEATIVGTTSVMRPDDYLIGTYRTHGHAIARGTEPRRVMAELFGREDGCSRGRGGSMHIFDRERRFMGGYGVVGGNLPLAAVGRDSVKDALREATERAGDLGVRGVPALVVDGDAYWGDDRLEAAAEAARRART